MSIYYQIETRYWRRPIPNVHDDSHDDMYSEDDLAQTTKTFHNSEPIEARKAAFQHYFSIIEVLYKGMEAIQTTDKQARIDLQQYLDSGNGIEYKSKFPELKHKVNTVDRDNRIEIYAIINGLKSTIHGVRYLDYTDRFDYAIIEDLQGLFLEHEYYYENSHSTNGHDITIDFTPIGGEYKSIIQTPVNWVELNEDYAGLEMFEHF
ncbi:hypothetical protein [Lacinutrix undariae]